MFHLIVLSPCNICGQVERFKSVDLFNGASIDKDYYLVVVKKVLNGNISLFIVKEINDLVQKHLWDVLGTSTLWVHVHTLLLSRC